MASPIQIVLNPENFEEAREASGGGGRKDFFADRDREFGAHKAALMAQIDTISGVLAAQSQVEGMRQGDIFNAQGVRLPPNEIPTSAVMPWASSSTTLAWSHHGKNCG